MGSRELQFRQDRKALVDVDSGCFGRLPPLGPGSDPENDALKTTMWRHPAEGYIRPKPEAFKFEGLNRLI